MIYILGENEQQVIEYAKTKHIRRCDFRVVHDKRDLMGLSNSDILLIGDYKYRKDWKEISEIILRKHFIKYNSLMEDEHDA